MTLFDSTPERDHREPATEAHVLITVKAAPNPSGSYGETVCVAGLRVDLEHTGWVRLYPVTFRQLTDQQSFRKYDVLRLSMSPVSRGADSRLESWRPDSDTFHVTGHLTTADRWRARRATLEPHIEDDVCALMAAAKNDPRAPSLALMRPARIDGVDISAHPGWTPEERRKLDKFATQPDLFSGELPRHPLEPPRFQLWYRYHCGAPACPSHRHQNLDWEFVAYQRRFQYQSDQDTIAALRQRFLEDMCGQQKETSFFLGNQSKRRQGFSVLGTFWPPR